MQLFPKQELELIVDEANLDLPQAAQPDRVDGCQVLPPQGKDNPGPQERSLPNLRQIAKVKVHRAEESESEQNHRSLSKMYSSLPLPNVCRQGQHS